MAVLLISPGFSASDFIDENKLPLADHRFPPEIISHAIWLYFRFPLSLHMVEEMLAARSIVVSHETVRQWALKFGQGFDRATRAEAFETWAEVAGARSAA